MYNTDFNFKNPLNPFNFYPLDTSKVHIWSKFGVSRALLASDLTSNIWRDFEILRNMCSKPIFTHFSTKIWLKLILAIYSTTNVGFYVHLKKNPLRKTHSKNVLMYRYISDL